MKSSRITCAGIARRVQRVTWVAKQLDELLGQEKFDTDQVVFLCERLTALKDDLFLQSGPYAGTELPRNGENLGLYFDETAHRVILDGETIFEVPARDVHLCTCVLTHLGPVIKTDYFDDRIDAFGSWQGRKTNSKVYLNGKLIADETDVIHYAIYDGHLITADSQGLYEVVSQKRLGWEKLTRRLITVSDGFAVQAVFERNFMQIYQNGSFRDVVFPSDIIDLQSHPLGYAVQLEEGIRLNGDQLLYAGRANQWRSHPYGVIVQEMTGGKWKFYNQSGMWDVLDEVEV